MKSVMFAAALAAFFACPVSAEPNCATTDQVREILSVRFGEEVIAAGLDEAGNVFEWWGNPDTGTWTLVGTQGGVSCVLGQGGGFSRASLRPNV